MIDKEYITEKYRLISSKGIDTYSRKPDYEGKTGKIKLLDYSRLFNSERDDFGGVCAVLRPDDPPRVPRKPLAFGKAF